MAGTDTVRGFAELHGAKLYYEIAGNGRPLVLVHAGIADARMWDGPWERFTRELRAMRYDLRGFGRSTMPSASFAHHDDLAALLRHLDIQACILVGASYGGNVATEFTLAHPEMVEALILVNSLVGMTEPSAGLRAGWTATDEGESRGPRRRRRRGADDVGRWAASDTGPGRSQRPRTCPRDGHCVVEPY